MLERARKSFDTFQQVPVDCGKAKRRRGEPVGEMPSLKPAPLDDNREITRGICVGF
jgi:hypothetical protein